MAKEFTGAMLEGVDRLFRAVNASDQMLAEELLDATYSDWPRPAWNTGELRASGAVYIGGKRHMRTSDLPNFVPGANPVGPYATQGKAGIAGTTGDVGGAKELKIGKLRKVTDADHTPDTVRGIITVIYSAPTAAMMHEWSGNFSDNEAGPLYISAKLVNFSGRFNEVFKRVLSGQRII